MLHWAWMAGGGGRGVGGKGKLPPLGSARAVGPVGANEALRDPVTPTRSGKGRVAEETT